MSGQGTKQRLRQRWHAGARLARQHTVVAVAKRVLAPPDGGSPVTWLGTSYGGWYLPDGLLHSKAICYLAGVGEDASFDLAVIDRFGCDIHAFDPVPEAAAYATGVEAEHPKWHFHPFGLWPTNGTLTFAANPIEGYVSRSATDMHRTGTGLQLGVRELRGVMAELGHDHIDLLKLSVEGSEYALIASLLHDRTPVNAVCVEFAQPASLARIRAAVWSMQAGGYDLAAFSVVPFNWKATFVRR